MIHTVGVADMKVSGSTGDEIVTHALGSCIGVTVFDPVAGVGGLLHVMLPQSSVDLVKASQNPFMFMDTGLPKLFQDAYKAGARKQRLIVAACGGANPRGQGTSDMFQIGQRNIVMLRKLLWQNGVLLKASDLGGTQWRTVSLHLGSGRVRIKMETGMTDLIPGRDTDPAAREAGEGLSGRAAGPLAA